MANSHRICKLEIHVIRIIHIKMNNSNQSGALLLLAIMLGATTYFFMFFGSEMEQKNMNASFVQLTTIKSNGLFSNNKANDNKFSTKEIRSDLSGVSLPNYKMKSTSGGNYTQTSTPDFPLIGVIQVDVNSNQSTTTSRTANYASSQSQAFAIGNSEIKYISNPQNPTKSDINALLLLDTHAAEAAMSTQQGTKRATPAIAGKTATVSENLTADKSTQKINGSGNPGEPSPSGSLPIGDGIAILLLFSACYSLITYNRFNVSSSLNVLKD